MGFSNNIFNAMGVICPSSYRITICGNNGIYLEGVNRILDIQDKTIIVLVKNGKITITGNKLKITSFYESDLSIKGEVLKIEKQEV